jgi:hypothetical protein
LAPPTLLHSRATGIPLHPVDTLLDCLEKDKFLTERSWRWEDWVSWRQSSSESVMLYAVGTAACAY